MKARGLTPKTVHYQGNGTGRDTYISSNNGGGCRVAHFKTANRPASLAVQPKSLNTILTDPEEMSTLGRFPLSSSMDSGGLINGSANPKRAYEAYLGALRSYEPNPGAMRRTWSTPGSRNNNNVYKINKGVAPNALNVVGQGVNEMHVSASASHENWKAYRTGWEELAKTDPQPAATIVNGKWDGNWATSTMPLPARPKPLLNQHQNQQQQLQQTESVGFAEEHNGQNGAAQPAVLTHQQSAPQLLSRRPLTAAAQLGVPRTRQAVHCRGAHFGVPIEQYGSVLNGVRPTSAKQAQQMFQSAYLSQPKWREIPFEKFLIASDRKELLKRKYQYQNRLFSYN